MLADMSRTKTPSRGVLITGASRGIGAAAARAFAKKGDRVVVHFHQQQQRAPKVQFDWRPLALLAAVAALGRVDVLVNAAALLAESSTGGRRGDHPLEHTAYADWVEIWQRTLAANLLGPANLTWQIARHMIEIKPADGIPAGRIVNVGSRGAYRGEPEVPAYGASKAGLHAFGQ